MVPSEKMRQQAQTKIQEIPFKHRKKHFYCEDGQILEEVFQQGCGFSILGDTQSSTGYGLEQPVVADPALSRGLGLHDLQRSFPFSTIL